MNLAMRDVRTIRAHDPFIVTDHGRGCYWWAADSLLSTGREDRTCGGVDIRRSDDLVTWSDPIPAWRPPTDFPAQWQYWAPELFEWKGRWYMFTTTTGVKAGEGILAKPFKPDHYRGTMIFVSDKPEGPYEPWSDGPIVSRDLLTLDGTFYVDKGGKPWMVYCHEWLQTVDGTIEAIALTDDLKQAAGEPTLLFKASDAPWAKGGYTEKYGDMEFHATIYVTDGPFLFDDLSGGLCMLWTTSNEGVYTTGIARSPSGGLLGPWEQTDAPLYDRDGGHAMLFKTLEGKDMLAMHCPHTVRDRSERLKLVPVAYTDTGLTLLED